MPSTMRGQKHNRRISKNGKINTNRLHSNILNLPRITSFTSVGDKQRQTQRSLSYFCKLFLFFLVQLFSERGKIFSYSNKQKRVCKGPWPKIVKPIRLQPICMFQGFCRAYITTSCLSPDLDPQSKSPPGSSLSETAAAPASEINIHQQLSRGRYLFYSFHVSLII